MGNHGKLAAMIRTLDQQQQRQQHVFRRDSAKDSAGASAPRPAQGSGFSLTDANVLPDRQRRAAPVPSPIENLIPMAVDIATRGFHLASEEADWRVRAACLKFDEARVSGPIAISRMLASWGVSRQTSNFATLLSCQVMTGVKSPAFIRTYVFVAFHPTHRLGGPNFLLSSLSKLSAQLTVVACFGWLQPQHINIAEFNPTSVSAPVASRDEALHSVNPASIQSAASQALLMLFSGAPLPPWLDDVKSRGRSSGVAGHRYARSGSDVR
ncbi:hypothetical protein AC579_2201 [Pseudocercospora musae]|uniref:Uncharacterized protein n=1 Tax=Pseudocercospora musae TaxID=113226 RepID=A0A139IKX6_9PEZI|nr:hypothetical protein AC579_2201 [Pseudocercospora musae]